MNTRLPIQTKPTPKPSFTLVRSELLQRKCACGNFAGFTSNCTGCQSQLVTAQRYPTSHAEVSNAPPILHEMSNSAGQLLVRDTRIVNQQNLTNDLSRIPIQAKLTIGAPNDKYEQEADRVAEEVTSMRDFANTQQRQQDNSVSVEAENSIQTQPLSEQITPWTEKKIEDASTQSSIALQREELGSGQQELPEGEEEDGTVLLKKLPLTTSQTTNNIGRELADSKGRGVPLSDGVRSFMEPRFGQDFSRVRVHTDSNASQMAQNLQAAAFTNGQDIYFNSGRYHPDSQTGKRLLAHELTHVLQQNSNHLSNSPQPTEFIKRRPIFQHSSLQISRISSNDAHLKWLQRQRVEAHVNLEEPQKVKLYRENESDILFSPVSAGPLTEDLIRLAPYSLTKRSDPTAQIGKWGLQYFAPFSGGIGFHSNIAYPKMATLCADGDSRCDRSVPQDQRLRITLRVDGTSRSHGCVRMRHADAITFFNSVSNGTPVRVYNRRDWRQPSWSP
ncbi:eCIS core domain-containing protein [Nostoc sp. CCY 9925]|uniref:eCIS core domain-containing protein n=1 Tax=Nostoc sp. CCY 9925 TaxID=3103865 RepID=UPI0039C64560